MVKAENFSDHPRNIPKKKLDFQHQYRELTVLL
jgi:hypothetical protein